MSSRYAVVCATCLYQNFHSSRWEANIDVAAHLRDNPTHSATVVEESQAVGRVPQCRADSAIRGRRPRRKPPTRV